jgi:hypothetical protein
MLQDMRPEAGAYTTANQPHDAMKRFPRMTITNPLLYLCVIAHISHSPVGLCASVRMYQRFRMA